MQHDPSDSGRRRFLLACGVAGLAGGLAGCLGGKPDSSDSADADSGTPEDTSEFASHPGDAPATIPAEHACDGVCGMAVAEFPEWNAQLAHDDGTGAFFCSSGCLVSYLVAPEWVDANDAETIGAWVRDFETKDWIDGEAAHYALEADEDRTDEPMGVNPRPFKAREDAEAYIERYDDLSGEDIIELAAFDLETAHMYRANRLPALE